MSSSDHLNTSDWLCTWDNLLGKIHHLEPELLTQSPAPESWSIQQVIQHLALSEHLSCRYLQKKTLDLNAIPPVDLFYPVRKALLFLYLYSPFRFKAPAMVATPQFPEEAMGTTLNRLHANQAELIDLIMQLPDRTRRGLVYKHPIVGRMDLQGMLQFFTWHIRHHNRQINRIIKQIKAQETRQYRPS